FQDYYKRFLSMVNARYAMGYDAEALKLLIADLQSKQDEFADAEAAGYAASACDYFAWFEEREAYRATYRDFFKDWDVLIAPANIVSAFRHNPLPWQERFFTINDQPVPYNRQMVYASLASLTGQPSTAFPVDFNDRGLAIGLQAVGPYLEDYTPIR